LIEGGTAKKDGQIYHNITQKNLNHDYGTARIPIQSEVKRISLLQQYSPGTCYNYR